MKHTIFDTTFMNYDYQEYVDNCNDNGVTPQGKDSQDFFTWCAETTMTNTEYDWENLAYSKAIKENMRFFVTGTLHLWNCSPDVHSRKIYDLKGAISSILGRDIDNYEVWVEDYHIYAKAYHHDGTNTFEIHLLSKKGEKAIQNLINSGKIEDCDLDFKKEWSKRFKTDYLW